MNAFIGTILVAAGQSKRMGFDKIFKPFANGLCPLEICLHRILNSPLVGQIVVVVSKENFERAMEKISTLCHDKDIKIAEGGKERQDSVYQGLLALDPLWEYVMVHDSARPFIKEELISVVFQAAREVGAAVCGKPCSDTLKEVDMDGKILKTLDRSKIWTVQTPQIFKRSLLEKAYMALQNQGDIVTDDASAVERIGGTVKVVFYKGNNMKMTLQEDWDIANLLLQKEKFN
ncbi:2-C-methyl-D-erythritol 4-phosphate cytidylyltransferase [Candidatus Methylacidiphilum fumarolicum]|uniref:2-C-methyl-D-erythritol 4-phosphate cytidylyltransferase n=2 Tax=Candidatus Methylacidiphilum fumarolicum TaxID=591154 RepID=I0JX44_METFB|nr:2-C-methyl-D-erythritol 4-phosphate cytidylyltransferase [Candidatus Methylacidiphilum fumarolicum]MBW6414500.1 2-C-methyl-D-erythritol 4-phosphate cytidylyltransferase [Candidatus Methylacidiphilum fumarolicum]TFE67297.1 2-C-methyl-D-erythritol 4-phosphate cytidylyltransferase [Candidatus Methylacidiphilum fumarolicum]TFE72408.1 2-C-methyl-D-erythritol 4-phosphate cytidylyltransferase [Candidatus Methylacidiphilum fumarolicum]TFE75845.1 2-C-methyl-D-erythritol 4-phosphate cytidylyltransfera